MSQDFEGGEYAGRFEFIAGWLCLDFANTINFAGTEGVGAGQNERLKGFAELAAWGSLAGVISPAGAAALLDAAGHRPVQARRALEEARTLRLAIHHVFSALAYGKRPNPADMASLNAAMRGAAPHLNIEARGGDGYALGWSAEAGDLRQALRPVAWSAAQLLTSPLLGQVKRCQGAGCAWLFLDETRNRSRRWCAMAHCGNRAKAMRHYARNKDTQA